MDSLQKADILIKRSQGPWIHTVVIAHHLVGKYPDETIDQLQSRFDEMMKIYLGK